MERPSNRLVLIVLLNAFADTPEAIDASYEQVVSKLPKSKRPG